MSQEIPGITPELHEVAIKPAELSASIRTIEGGLDKTNFEDALKLFKEYRAALYASRITLTALLEMGVIRPDFDTQRFQKEIDKIRLRLGLPIEPSILNDDSPIYVIDLDKEKD